MILKGSVYSDVLGMDTGITVIAPRRKTKRPCRAAYLFHGLYGNNGNWADYTMLPHYAEQYDIVFVMPETARSCYTDMELGLPYFTYVCEELPEICADTFHISTEREDTIVIGGSMGGYGALKCALSRPGQYGWCLAFSSAGLYMESLTSKLKEDPNLNPRLTRDLRAAFGPELSPSAESELTVLAGRAKSVETMPNIYMLCGKDDPLRAENAGFSLELKALGFPVSYRELPGGHDWQFFSDALGKGLRDCF